MGVTMIRIIVAEDQHLVRKGIVGLLKLNNDFEVIAEASDGIDAYNKIIELKPDVALLDIKMPKMNGIDVLEKLNNAGVKINSILLTTFNDEDLYKNALVAGVNAFLLKDVSIEILSDTIYKAAKGEHIINPLITPKTIEKIQADTRFISIDDITEELTKREIEVLKLISNGYSNKEIGELLSISTGVVKNYTSAIFQKLNVRDRTRAVLKAIEMGLI